MRLKNWFAAITLAAASIATAQVNIFMSLDKAFRQGNITTYRATATVSGGVLTAVFNSSVPYPTVYVKTMGSPQWGAYQAFSFTLMNTSAQPVQFKIRLDDNMTLADGINHCRTGVQYIDAGTKETFIFPLGIDPNSYGMRGLPAVGNATWLTPTIDNLNENNVVRMLLFLDHPSADTTLKMSDMRLIRNVVDFNGIVDKYGQYTRDSWIGKVFSNSEFAGRNSAEQRDLTGHVAISNRNAYGGWASAPNLGASGRFKIGNYNGKWTFIDPTGRPYFMFGMDTVNQGDDTIIHRREYMFSWLPAQSDPLAQFYGRISDTFHTSDDGLTYKFYSANLYRKYGVNFDALAQTRALTRLKSWGFNSIGNWSDWRLWSRHLVPYSVGISSEGGTFSTLTVDPARKPMPDPFDVRYATTLAAKAALISPTVIGDPYCVGWYVENEPTMMGPLTQEESGRYGIAYAVASRTIAVPAKAQFVTDLKTKYLGLISNLNASWGTGFTSWTPVENGFTLTGTSTVGRRVDLQNFCLKFLRKYFQVNRDTVRLKDAGALYLGSRFFRFTQESMQACSEYANVISLTWYHETADANWATTYANLNKPVMVSEFHFGALDRGMFSPGLVTALDQDQRAQKFGAFVNSCLASSIVVGCTWHQYIDPPLTGRVYDGENYAIGWTSVVDEPYTEMINAARQTFTGAYERRFQ